MTIQTFKRYEKKYIINNKMKEDILKELSPILRIDEYCADKPYSLYNYYFDTDNFNIIKQSIESVGYKEKMRIRAYRFPLEKNEKIFLELKMKSEKIVYKRRIILNYKKMLDYIFEKEQPEFNDYFNNQVLKEIDYFEKIKEVKPKFFISYNRIAYFGINDSNLRITFDNNILGGETEGLRVLNCVPLLDEEYWLMEIKFSNVIPYEIVKVLSSNRIFSTSFSKYGKFYEMRRKTCTTY